MDFNFNPALYPQLIQAGKGEALRIRAILRSLVPIEDLVGVISLPVQIPTFGKGTPNFTMWQFRILIFIFQSVFTIRWNQASIQRLYTQFFSFLLCYFS